MSQSDRPNVIMVLADQMHAGLMGCAGHPQAKTPNFDRFAAEGVRFTNAYCQNPICTPSRVSILSGQYCHNHGYYGLSGPAWFELPNLFRHFRAHGYRTSAHGKLHLPQHPRNWIADDVDFFDDTYETIEGAIGESDFFNHLNKLGLRELEDSWHNPWHYGEGTIIQDTLPSDLPYEHTQERWCVDRALSFIDQDDSQPFCMQIAFQKPHHPLLPQQQFLDLYDEDIELPETYYQDPSHRPAHFQKMWQRMHRSPEDEQLARRVWRGTLACISQIDDVFGRLLAGLEQRDLRQNTIIIYGSDHGCYHSIHGLPEKAPGICSDAVSRVPMIWQVPGQMKAGAVCDQLVENVDMTPTLCSLAGLPPMTSTDGRDISGLLRGQDEAVREVAVTENPWSKGLRWKQYRFVHYQREMFGEDVGELYDLLADPGETKNLYNSTTHRETVAECRRLLLEWLIASTRNRTVHPSVEREPIGALPGLSHAVYISAGDGKESNEYPVASRLQGNTNYI